MLFFSTKQKYVLSWIQNIILFVNLKNKMLAYVIVYNLQQPHLYIYF